MVRVRVRVKVRVTKVLKVRVRQVLKIREKIFSTFTSAFFPFSTFLCLFYYDVIKESKTSSYTTHSVTALQWTPSLHFSSVASKQKIVFFLFKKMSVDSF